MATATTRPTEEPLRTAQTPSLPTYQSGCDSVIAACDTVSSRCSCPTQSLRWGNKQARTQQQSACRRWPPKPAASSSSSSSSSSTPQYDAQPDACACCYPEYRCSENGGPAPLSHWDCVSSAPGSFDTDHCVGMAEAFSQSTKCQVDVADKHRFSQAP